MPSKIAKKNAAKVNEVFGASLRVFNVKLLTVGKFDENLLGWGAQRAVSDNLEFKKLSWQNSSPEEVYYSIIINDYNYEMKEKQNTIISVGMNEGIQAHVSLCGLFFFRVVLRR